MNPVEVIYASFPFFLYMNASYGGQLLAPLLEFQDSQQWTQPYAARDLGVLYRELRDHITSDFVLLGTTYPQASGTNTPHSQGVEREYENCLNHPHLTSTESGNMLIMSLAHAKASNDWSLVQHHASGF